jgi:hypothetical protein
MKRNSEAHQKRNGKKSSAGGVADTQKVVRDDSGSSWRSLLKNIRSDVDALEQKLEHIESVFYA